MADYEIHVSGPTADVYDELSGCLDSAAEGARITQKAIDAIEKVAKDNPALLRFVEKQIDECRSMHNKSVQELYKLDRAIGHSELSGLLL